MSELFDFLRKAKTKKFIQDHLQSDIRKLLLNPPSEFRDQIKDIVGQILARQKGKGKLDSWVNNSDLIFPPPLSVEQSSSEKAATYKKSIISGNHLIDLTGGMGIDCLTLSDNFLHTTYVEMQSLLVSTFEHNCQVLGRQIETKCEDASRYLNLLDSNIEGRVVFIDPARRDEGENRVFKLQDCSPDLQLLLPQLRTKASNVLVKLSPLLEIKSVLQVLQNVKEVHVVSIRNECKELLFLIDFSHKGPARIKTINIEDSVQNFEFYYAEEEEAHTEIGDSSKYLLEPNSSILKSGAFKKVSSDFGVIKLNTNTHLYSSEKRIPDWPGRTFEVVELNMDKKSLAKFAPNGFINVIARNYPLNAKALKAKFKVNDGGEFFLIGFRDCDEKARLVVGRRC
ncbi:MAG: class I SAM-dependent methyltransferase [Cyclobacteriaceae bacterium]